MDTNQALMNQAQQLAAAVDAVDWKGAAEVAFKKLMTAFARDTQVLNDSLVRIADEVDASAKAYEAQNAASAQSISGIAAALDGI